MGRSPRRRAGPVKACKSGGGSSTLKNAFFSAEEHHVGKSDLRVERTAKRGDVGKRDVDDEAPAFAGEAGLRGEPRVEVESADRPRELLRALSRFTSMRLLPTTTPSRMACATVSSAAVACTRRATLDAFEKVPSLMASSRVM